MAQDEMRRSPDLDIKSEGISNSHKTSNNNNNNNNNASGSRSFKFNVNAAEFVPRSYNNNSNAQMSLSTGYFYPCVQFLQDGDHHLLGSPPPEWFYVNPPTPPPPPPLLDNNGNNRNGNNDDDDDDNITNNDAHPPHLLRSNSAPTRSNNSLINDLQLKIIKQVEYLFSDLSLMANDTMAKHVNKDPEGYVPIPVIASMKKIKALVSDHHLLVQALRSSTKLVVNKDNKKVKRRSPFTENYRDELQCRTVIVENLPDDHSYQNLEKIFRVVGSVKAIRLCHPPEANPSRSKNEVITSNKLHALVEYENAEFAEKAAEKLNDERNWRKGMRVRVMLRRSPKSVLKNRKTDFDMLTDDDELSHPESAKATSQSNSAELSTENNNGEETCGTSRKSSTGRGRIKTKGRSPSHNNNNDRGLLSSPTHSSIMTSPMQCDSSMAKQINKGPRMPDGTRGFTMGRGKHPLTSSMLASPLDF